MGPPSYMWSVVSRNVMQHIPVFTFHTTYIVQAHDVGHFVECL